MEKTPDGFDDRGNVEISSIELVPLKHFAPNRKTPSPLVRIPGGSFRSGEREIALDPFAIGRCEVTNAEYERFFPEHRERRDSFSWRDRDPVIYVSWTDAARYCNRLSAEKGLKPAYDEPELAADPGRGRFPASERSAVGICRHRARREPPLSVGRRAAVAETCEPAARSARARPVYAHRRRIGDDSGRQFPGRSEPGRRTGSCRKRIRMVYRYLSGRKTALREESRRNRRVSLPLDPRQLVRLLQQRCGKHGAGVQSSRLPRLHLHRLPHRAAGGRAEKTRHTVTHAPELRR